MSIPAYSSDAAARTQTNFGEHGIRNVTLSNTFVEYDCSSIAGRWVSIHCTEAAYMCDGASSGFTPVTGAAATPTEFVVKPIEAGTDYAYFINPARPYLQFATRVASGTAQLTINCADVKPAFV